MKVISSISDLLLREIVINEKKITFLSVSSPAELQEELFKLKSQKNKIQFVIISLTGSKPVVCPFSFKDVKGNQIDDLVKLKAVEILNLSVEDLVVDHQVFISSAGNRAGVFVCLSRERVEEYLKICDKFQIIALSLLPSSLSHIDILFEHINDGRRICILDLSKEKMVSLNVVHNNKCQFFRDIPFYNVDDAVRNIEQSLRSANLADRVKDLKEIYYYAGSENISELVEKLEEKYSRKLVAIDVNKNISSVFLKRKLFTANLLNEYCLSLKTRRGLDLVFTGMLLFMTFLCAILTVQALGKDAELNQIKSLYSSTDLDHVRQLQERINSQ